MVEIFANRPIGAVAEIFNFYENANTGKFFSGYGFVNNENKMASSILVLIENYDQWMPLLDQKLEILPEFLDNDGNLIDFEIELWSAPNFHFWRFFLGWLRFLAIDNQSDWTNFQKRGDPINKRRVLGNKLIDRVEPVAWISVWNELKTFEQVKKLVLEALGMYPTSPDDDDRVLEDQKGWGVENLNLNKQNSVKVRRIEKMLLVFWVKICDGVIGYWERMGSGDGKPDLEDAGKKSPEQVEYFKQIYYQDDVWKKNQDKYGGKISG